MQMNQSKCTMTMIQTSLQNPQLQPNWKVQRILPKHQMMNYLSTGKIFMKTFTNWATNITWQNETKYIILNWNIHWRATQHFKMYMLPKSIDDAKHSPSQIILKCFTYKPFVLLRRECPLWRPKFKNAHVIYDMKRIQNRKIHNEKTVFRPICKFNKPIIKKTLSQLIQKYLPRFIYIYVFTFVFTLKLYIWTQWT